MKEWTTPDCRNTPSTTDLEEEEIVDAPGNDGNTSMPEQVKRPNPVRKVVMIMMMMITLLAKIMATFKTVTHLLTLSLICSHTVRSISVRTDFLK